MMDDFKAAFLTLGIFLILSSCTAVKVLTHNPGQNAQGVHAGLYHVDPDHRSLIFKVEHLGFSRFVGRFDDWEGTLFYTPQAPENSRLEVSINLSGLSTSSQTMTEVVVGKAMLNKEQFPVIQFNLENVTLTGPASGHALGTATIAGRKAPLEFDIIFKGAAKNPLNGRETLGFSASGTLNRHDFGLTSWPIVVGREISFEIDAEFRLEKPVE